MPDISPNSQPDITPASDRRWHPVALAPDVPPPAGAYSPAVRAGPFVFVSGQVPKDPRSGQVVGDEVREQTAQVLRNLAGALEAAGASLADVVSMSVFLADERDWPAFNEVYRDALVPPYPTRTVVGARLRGILVEVSAIAYVG